MEEIAELVLDVTNSRIDAEFKKDIEETCNLLDKAQTDQVRRVKKIKMTEEEPNEEENEDAESRQARM